MYFKCTFSFILSEHQNNLFEMMKDSKFYAKFMSIKNISVAITLKRD